MKTIQNWDKFNEMRDEVYQSAARKLKKMGHTDKAKRLSEHPDFLRKITNPYKDMEPFSFSVTPYDLLDKGKWGKKIQFTGIIEGIEPGMTMDMYNDTDGEQFSLSPFFRMTDEEGNEGVICPFWVIKESDEIIIGEATNIEESPWGDLIQEGSQPIYFTNAKDARRFITYLKTDALKEWDDLKSRIGDNEGFDKSLEEYNRVVNQLNPKMLYR